MDSFVGQIQAFAFGYAPRGWALCDGSRIAIQSNVALFSLLGVTYGGDGRTYFNLPDLRGRVSTGASYGGGNPALGAATGSATVTLDQTQIAAHTHNLVGTTGVGGTTVAAGNAFATTEVGSKGGGTSGFTRYSTNTPGTTLSPASLAAAGGGQPHNNMQPYLGVNYYICLEGIFPQRP